MEVKVYRNSKKKVNERRKKKGREGGRLELGLEKGK